MLLNDYEIFDEIVRAGSLSVAARNIGSSPAQVSKRLARLEERLGACLIHRTTRKLAVSEEGRRFHESIADAVATIRAAEAELSRADAQSSGRLRISAPTSFGRLHIAPALSAFLDDNPGLELELELSDSYVNLLDGRFDVAVRICSVPDSGLVGCRLAENSRILCAAPSYLERHGAPVSLRSLSEHHLLAAQGQLPWRLEGPSGRVNLTGRSYVRTNSSEVVRELALSGAGIALRSLWDVSDALTDGRLVRVLDDYAGSSEVSIHALYPKTEFVPPAVQRFVEFLTQHFVPQPPWQQERP